MFIDTHAHLYFDHFNEDREAVLRRAREVRVDRIINIGIDIRTSRQSIAYAERYDMVYATAGVHPHDADKAQPDYLSQVEEMIAHPKVVAIGEVGLDFYRDYSPRPIQLEVLHRQLDLAVASGLPLVVHTREAWRDIYPIFETKYKDKLTGVFHCFSGEYEDAKRVLDLGFYLSFTGVVTYKNAGALKIAASIPDDRLLLETDCPFMAPVPKRGERCEPAYIPYIAEKIAEMKNMDVEELGANTSRNAEALFAKLKRSN